MTRGEIIIIAIIQYNDNNNDSNNNTERVGGGDSDGRWYNIIIKKFLNDPFVVVRQQIKPNGVCGVGEP